MYVTVTKKSLVAAIALLLLAAAVFSRFSAAGMNPENGDTNSHRLDFIKSLNISVKEECIETADISVPTVFGEVYTRYNEIQKQAGYDLLPYVGCDLKRYTYQVADEPDRRVNLLVYKKRIIGGDISDNALDGDMLPLKKQKKKE